MRRSKFGAPPTYRERESIRRNRSTCIDSVIYRNDSFEIARIHTETAEADEETAQTAYDKLTQENAVTKTTKQGDVKGKTNEVKQLEVALGNYKENKATTSKELDAVLTYLDKLKPQCETKVGLGRS